MMAIIERRVDGPRPADSCSHFERWLQCLRELSPRWFAWSASYREWAELSGGRSLAELMTPLEELRPTQARAPLLALRDTPQAGLDHARLDMLASGDYGRPILRLSVFIVDDLDDNALQDWLRRALRLDVDFAAIGPKRLVRSQHAGWLTYRREMEWRNIPDGATWVDLGDQVTHRRLLRAHPWDASAESKPAQDAIEAIGRLLRQEDEHVELASWADLLRARSPMTTAPDADTTAMLPSEFTASPSLPFIPPQPSAGPTFDADQTLPLPMVAVVHKSSGSFVDQLDPIMVPVLSIEAYADLRAQLSDKGEDDPATLARFGIQSKAAHAALKLEFAEYFKRDPAAVERFVNALRSSRAGMR